MRVVLISNLRMIIFEHFYYFVDDMLIASMSISKIETIKSLLQAIFEIKDLGPAQKILRMEIPKDKKIELYLSQRSYIKKVIDRFSMKDAKLVSILIAH